MLKLSAKEHYMKFILYLAVIVLVNIVGITLFFRVDLTANKIYSLSPASKEAVATLSEPLNIKVFFSKNMPAPHNNTERYLRDLLTEYAAQAGRFFNFTFYNLDQEGQTAEQNRKMAQDYGIQPVQIRVMENDELKFKNAYMGLVILHGDLIEKIPAVTATDGLEYQLTTTIQKLNNKVSALVRQRGEKEKIRTTLYLSSGLNPIAPLIGIPELPGLARAVTERVEDLNRKSLGILEFTHVDVNTEAQMTEVAKTYDLMALSWPDVPEENIKAGHGTAGIIMAYKGETIALPLITAMELPIIGTTYQMADPAGLEEELTAIMEKMIGINQDIGYLSGHGSPTLGPDRMAMMQGRPGNGLDVFSRLLGARYTVKEIALEEDHTIPEGLNTLIIAKPTQKFTDYELFQIDQALMKGTNIAIFSDAFAEQQMPGGMGMPPSYTPIDTGLEKLLAHYGVTIEPAYILDKNAYRHQLPQAQGGGEQVIYFAPLLKENTINTAPAFMKNIKGLVAMQASPVDLVQEQIDSQNLTATRLFSSSNESWLMKENINLNPMFLTPPANTQEMASETMAYLIEGSFTSYFAGKSIPVKETTPQDTGDIEAEDTADAQAVKAAALEGVKAQTRIIETGAPAKLLVVGCSQILYDNMLDDEGRSTNATFLLNSIDHLNGQDQVAFMRSKQQTLNPVAQTTALTKTIFKTFNVAILPVLVALFGLGIMVLRNLKKKKIAQMYHS